MKHTLSITVKNETGVLTRICSLFSSRGFNILSLVVAQTEKVNLSKILLLTEGDSETIDQIGKQLHKLVQVMEIENLTQVSSVERELVLIHIHFSDMQKLRNDIQDFGGKIIDHGPKSLGVELTSSPGKINAFLRQVQDQGIVQIVRTGTVSIPRVPIMCEKAGLYPSELGTEGLEPSRSS